MCAWKSLRNSASHPAQSLTKVADRRKRPPPPPSAAAGLTSAGTCRGFSALDGRLRRKEPNNNNLKNKIKTEPEEETQFPPAAGPKGAGVGCVSGCDGAPSCLSRRERAAPSQRGRSNPSAATDYILRFITSHSPIK